MEVEVAGEQSPGEMRAASSGREAADGHEMSSGWEDMSEKVAVLDERE